MRNIAFFLLPFLFAAADLCAQDTTSSLVTFEYNCIRGWGLGIGRMSLGASGFNDALTQLRSPEPPSFATALTLTRFVANPRTRIFRSLNATSQSYSHTNASPGTLNYSFTKQCINYEVGYFLLSTRRFVVPASVGLGILTTIFNSHVVQNSGNTSFKSAVQNGTGPGIFNFLNFDVLAMASVGFDLKTSLFGGGNCRFASTNIGIRVSYLRSFANFNKPWDPGLKSVTDLPKTDPNLFYFGLQMTRFLKDCKVKG